MKCVDDFRLKFGKQELVPIMIGGMGVDISTADLALEAARLGGIGHISDAMVNTVADRRFNAKFVKEKLQQYKFNVSNPDKSVVQFDLGQLAEATRLHVGKTMESKRGEGLVFVNVMVFVLAFFLDFFELSFIIVPLLGPIADKMGIDLVWFGVLLAVNMQTSFMHPPFGSALFFLRSVAPDKPYVDHVTGKTIAPVTTMQIYKGAIPFLVLQLAMVAILIAFPGMVTSQLDKKVDVDMNAVGTQMLDSLNQQGLNFGEPTEEETPGTPAGDSPSLPGLEPPAGTASETAATDPAAPVDDPVKALEQAAGKP